MLRSVRLDRYQVVEGHTTYGSGFGAKGERLEQSFVFKIDRAPAKRGFTTLNTNFGDRSETTSRTDSYLPFTRGQRIVTD
jgi:hypothetical protein